MDSTNPYASPQVEETVFQLPHRDPTSAALFEYRYSSRNIGSMLGSVPIFLVTVAIFKQLFANHTTANINTFELPWAMILSAIFFSLSSFILAGFIFPRVWELRVDREFVAWQTPWPKATHQRIPIPKIERVEYHGSQVAIVADEGHPQFPPELTYGKRTKAVVDAISAAVVEHAPETIVRNRRTKPVSLLRKLGGVLGTMMRWLRLIR